MLNLGEMVPSMVVPKHILVKAIREVPASVYDAQNEEEVLLLRHKHKRQERQKLTIEFTRDPALIHQYCRLYNDECRIVPEFVEAEQELNRKSHILVVRQGDLVVGGGRLFVTSPRKNKELPLELEDFRVADHFPELTLKQMTYGEISRLVVLPDFRGEEMLKDIIVNMHRKCVSQGVDVLFAAAPLINVRSYRKISRSIGIKEVGIVMDIEIPPYPGFEEVKDYLFRAVIDRNDVDYEQFASSFAEGVLLESV